jgi:hypothetical protein
MCKRLRKREKVDVCVKKGEEIRLVEEGERTGRDEIFVLHSFD